MRHWHRISWTASLSAVHGDAENLQRRHFANARSLTSEVISLSKQNERYTCIYLVPSAMIRKSPIHLCITRWGTDLARWRNDLYVSEQDVDETTCERGCRKLLKHTPFGMRAALAHTGWLFLRLMTNTKNQERFHFIVVGKIFYSCPAEM